MNLLITTRCNKGCSFCFAQQKNQQHKEMTFEDFKKLLDFIQHSVPTPQFKLLGGEPTIHPEFIKFLEEITKRNLVFTLISNGLYVDPETRIKIKQCIEKGLLRSILFNVAELTPKTLEIFKQNYQDVLPQARNSAFDVTCGVTLHRDWSCKEELAYLTDLFTQLEVHHLRISLDYSGGGFDNFFLNNKDYGKKILEIIDLCNQRHIVVSGDCVIYPCIFEDQFFVRKKLRHFLAQTSFICAAGSMPFDVYPDLSYFHCYPANKVGGKNLLAFDNYQQASIDMQMRKQALMSLQQKPEQCQQCNYFKNKECLGLCLGCNLPQSILTESLA